MLKKGDPGTEIDKGPFIFTLIALVAGLCVTLLLFILGKGDSLAIFAGILFAVVTCAAAAVMFALVTDRAYISDGVLHMNYLFKRNSIAVRDIGKITYGDDVYRVFDRKGNEAGTVNAKLTGIGELIFALEQQGVNFV